MSLTDDIFGKSRWVEGVGSIHPIKLKDYDEFLEYSGALYYSKAHFGEENYQHPLLDLIIYGLKEAQIIEALQNVFRMVTHAEVHFFFESQDKYGFSINENQIINRENYDLIRGIIMRQNLMIEQKVYKNKLTQEWAEKALKAKSKNGVNVTFEDMVSTVSAYTGKHYWDLQEYTIYQLQTDFNRIGKLIEYKTTIAFKCAGDTKSNLSHYAEHVDLFKDPHDELFVSQDKLKGLNQAMGQ